MLVPTMPTRLTVAPPWSKSVHANAVRPVRSWPSMSSADLDDPDLEDDDPYIAFRNARGSLGRWAPRMGGTRWMASDPGGRLAGAEEWLASGAPPIILDNGMKVRVDGRHCEGRFGDVLLGKADDGSSVAIKVALRRTSQLATEAACLRAVAGSAGFPRLLAHHPPSDQHASELLVMELLGDSVQTLWERATRRTHFSSPTVRHIGRGTLRCLRALHRAGYVHNDLKPPNVLLGAASSAAADEMHSTLAWRRPPMRPRQRACPLRQRQLAAHVWARLCSRASRHTMGTLPAQWTISSRSCTCSRSWRQALYHGSRLRTRVCPR